MKLNSCRGDTLIEVIISITLFGLVAIGAINVMVQGVATTQRALEVTLVRQEIDAQTSALRFLHNAYVASYKSGIVPGVLTPAGQWFVMTEYVRASALTSASEFGSKNQACPTAPKGSFILNTKNAQVVTASASLTSAQLYSRVTYDATDTLKSSEGIWIEGVRSPDVTTTGLNTAGYIDFHIRACWITSGQSTPSTIGTIVRLYEPRN